ncbi:MAG: nucleotide-binding universal stress UspA family protein [Cellvibrionaceae bacterium]|jgi:nucleotide-binding universal stress UspA family protein
MFKKILIPIDLEETALAEKAVEIAIDQARKHGAEIHVLTVFPGFGMPLVASFFPENAMQDALNKVSEHLKKYVSETFPDDINTYAIVTEGNPSEQVLHQAKKTKADLIIIPSHNRSASEFFLGSCATKVVSHAECSVMVIKA